MEEDVENEGFKICVGENKRIFFKKNGFKIVFDTNKIE